MTRLASPPRGVAISNQMLQKIVMSGQPLPGANPPPDFAKGIQVLSYQKPAARTRDSSRPLYHLAAFRDPAVVSQTHILHPNSVGSLDNEPTGATQAA